MVASQQHWLRFIVACGLLLAACQTTSNRNDRKGSGTVPGSPNQSATSTPSAGAPGNQTPAVNASGTLPASVPAPIGTDPGTAGDGNQSIGPNYKDDQLEKKRGDVPEGRLEKFTMTSAESQIYTGRDPWLNSQSGYSRDVWVYIPSQAQPGAALPVLVVLDGSWYMQVPTLLDNLIHDGKLPVMAAVLINAGGGDGAGSQRGLEYDTVSGAFATYIQTEVLPRITRDYQVKFTDNPAGRAAMGGSSGGSGAFSMAWFHPEWFSRVLSYSGSFVSIHADATYPHGAYAYAESLIAQTPRKDIRVFMTAGENDNRGNGDTYHNWLEANQHVAAALAQQGYHYQYLYAKGAGHNEGKVTHQTLVEALLWLWRGYPIP